MKNLLVFVCLLMSMTVNAQVVDWKHFDEKTMNDVMFNTISKHVTGNGGSIGRLPLEKYNLKEIGKSHSWGKDVDNISTVDNCKCLMTYQRLGENYILSKKNKRDFFLDAKYKNQDKVMISSHYNKRKKSVRVEFLYVYDIN